MEIPKGFKIRIDPQDDYTHPVEEAKNYNESMYINLFDFSKKIFNCGFNISKKHYLCDLKLIGSDK